MFRAMKSLSYPCSEKIAAKIKGVSALSVASSARNGFAVLAANEGRRSFAGMDDSDDGCGHKCAVHRLDLLRLIRSLV